MNSIKVTLPGTPGTIETITATDGPMSAKVLANGALLLRDAERRIITAYAAGSWVNFHSDAEQAT